MKGLYIIIIILLAIIAMLCFRILQFKREVRSIASQLKRFTDREGEKNISIECFNKEIEELAIEINKNLELYRKGNQENKAFQTSFKQGIVNVSHDMRTPLTVIIGYIKMMQSGKIDINTGMDILDDKSQFLRSLVNDFFELMIIENESYNLELEYINLVSIVQDEILLFYDEFNRRNIEPLISIQDEEIMINGEVRSIKRVVQNLISNALKYGQGQIEIKVYKLENKGTLFISNKVNNMSEKDVRHMFDAFYMADKSRSFESSGVGLSVVKNLMLKMGGDVTAVLKENVLSITCQWNIN